MLRVTVRRLDWRAWARDIRTRSIAGVRDVARDLRALHADLLRRGRAPDGSALPGGDTPLIDTGRLRDAARVSRTRLGAEVRPPDDRRGAVLRAEARGQDTIFVARPDPSSIDAEGTINEALAQVRKRSTTTDL